MIFTLLFACSDPPVDPSAPCTEAKEAAWHAWEAVEIARGLELSTALSELGKHSGEPPTDAVEAHKARTAALQGPVHAAHAVREAFAAGKAADADVLAQAETAPDAAEARRLSAAARDTCATLE